MRLKSEKVDNFEVVKRSANIGRSGFCNLAHHQIHRGQFIADKEITRIPQPLS